MAEERDEEPGGETNVVVLLRLLPIVVWGRRRLWLSPSVHQPLTGPNVRERTPLAADQLSGKPAGHSSSDTLEQMQKRWTPAYTNRYTGGKPWRRACTHDFFGRTCGGQAPGNSQPTVPVSHFD